MHHPTDQARPSLYYDYHVQLPWLPQQDTDPKQHSVVIVGAGPAGLTLALELARQKIAVTIIESELQVSEGSRAIVFTRRSMEILQQVGVDKAITEQGLPWCYGNSYYRGQRVFRMENPHPEDDRFYPMINLQQQYLEEYLLDAINAQPLIEVRWGNKVTEVTQNARQATLQVATSAGSYQLNTDWVVAADGARSVIRQQLNLTMEGASYSGRFVIADIKIDLPLPTERLAFFDPEWNPGNTVLMHREPHGIWRIDYQLPTNESSEHALTIESLTERINATLAQVGHADKAWQLDWASVYSARALTLPDYKHGRVLFVGDAAHMLPIFGVRGANTGFQDAQSLGWHLAYVINGLAPEHVLNNYSHERVGAAREIIEEAGKSTRFMAPPTAGFRLLRDAVLSLSLSQEFVRPLYHWRTSRPHAYHQSPLNCEGDDNLLFDTGPSAGAPPKNVRLAQDRYLLDVVGGSFDLLYFSVDDSVPKALSHCIEQNKTKGLPLRLLVVSAQKKSSENATIDQILYDPENRIAMNYGLRTAGGAYLFRPDQHICGRWVNIDATRLQHALQSLFTW